MKLYMLSLGCAKNLVDSEMILGLLKKKMTLVEDVKEADLIIINTVSVEEEKNLKQ